MIGAVFLMILIYFLIQKDWSILENTLAISFIAIFFNFMRWVPGDLFSTTLTCFIMTIFSFVVTAHECVIELEEEEVNNV